MLRDCGASLIFADAKHLPVARQASTGHELKVALIDDPDAPRPEPRPSMLPPTVRMGRRDPGTARSARDVPGGSRRLHPVFLPSPKILPASSTPPGTTSDPKGVMLSHANLRGEMESVFRLIPFDSTDAILGVLPLFHALAQMANLMLPLACGARVVFLEALNTTELLRALTERNITLFCCVPQFFYLIHERVFQEARKRGPSPGPRSGDAGAFARGPHSRAEPGQDFLQESSHPARPQDALSGHRRFPLRRGDRP